MAEPRIVLMGTKYLSRFKDLGLRSLCTAVHLHFRHLPRKQHCNTFEASPISRVAIKCFFGCVGH